MRFKIDTTVLCEVHVWGYVEADSMEEAMGKAVHVGTDTGHDHEIISDIKTLSVEVKEVQA